MTNPEGSEQLSVVEKTVQALKKNGCKQINMEVLRGYEEGLEPRDLIFIVTETFYTGMISTDFPYNPNTIFLEGTYLEVTREKPTVNNLKAGKFGAGAIIIQSDDKVERAIKEATQKGINIFMD